MALAIESASLRKGSRLLSTIAVLAAIVAASVLLFPAPLADVFFTGWVLFSVLLALVGGIAAWTERTPLLWVAALLMTGLAIIGMWSIGFLIAPAALFLLGAALLLQGAGPRSDVREAILTDPPTVPEAVMRTLAGACSVVIGGILLYVGALTRELFGACAKETLECAIAKTHWGAVGISVGGLTAIALGTWLLWQQVYIARVLASNDSRAQ